MDQSTTTSLNQNVDLLFTNLEDFTHKEGVIGKPVTLEDKTFLPVVSITLGYGGGNTANKSHPEAADPNQPMSNMSANMSGGALGMGAKLITEAVIVVDKAKDDVSLISLNQPGTSQLAEKLPQMIMNMSQSMLGGQGQNKQGSSQGQSASQSQTGSQNQGSQQNNGGSLS